MEAAGHRRQWILRIVLFLLCMSIAAVTHTKAEVPTCQDGREFLASNQICCDKCPAGYKLIENCQSQGQRSNCTRCPAGQFIDQMNFFPNCRSCDRCRASHFKVDASSCKKEKNTICRCMDGYYKYNIDSHTFECRKCTLCGANKRVIQNCTTEHNTMCECKDKYYRVKNNCLPCTNCTTECEHHCTVSQTTKGLRPTFINEIAGVVCIVVVMLVLVLVIVITYVATKWQTKRKLLKKSSQQCDQPAEIYQKLTVHSEEPPDHSLHSVPEYNVIGQEPSNLPDCVPLEIKSPEVIYTVLDLVPVKQVKQLVRSLGVTEAVIEHAELDYRSSKEAHYQMLRQWAEKGTQGGVLHKPLLHELLDKLRQMHLEQTAEELETKYNLM